MQGVNMQHSEEFRNEKEINIEKEPAEVQFRYCITNLYAP